MTGPLFLQGAFSYETSLWIALIIGFFFGFVLERAGFGDSRNLTSIFYFRDMRVLRVMFSALSTAMVGLIFLSWVGLFDYSILLEYSLLETYLWPQVVGGILFGLGFVVGGYCPKWTSTCGSPRRGSWPTGFGRRSSASTSIARQPAWTATRGSPIRSSSMRRAPITVSARPAPLVSCVRMAAPSAPKCCGDSDTG